MTIRELGEKLKQLPMTAPWLGDIPGWTKKIDALIAVAEAADAGSTTYAQIGALRAALEEEHEHEWVLEHPNLAECNVRGCHARIVLPCRGKVGA